MTLRSACSSTASASSVSGRSWTIVERAQARGELPADLDARVVVGTIVGPIVFRKLIWRQPIDAAYLSGCLDVAIAGLSQLNR